MASIAERLRNVNINLYQCIIFLGKLLLLVLFAAAMVSLLFLPTIAVSIGARDLPEPFPLLSSVQRIPQPTAIPSNRSGSSSQNTQSQQTSDNAIANDTITAAGVFAAVVGVILAVLTLAAAIATGVGIFEVNRIRQFRKQFDKRLEKLDKRIEAELGHLDKRIDTESQKFIEAAFYFSEGSKFYRSGDNHHAIEFYLRALKLQPKNLSILERLGRAYSNLNDTDNAFKYFNEAIALNSKDETVLRSLSLLYRSMEPQKAIEYLKGIVQKNPKAFEAWDFLGLCYRDQLIRNQELIKDQTLIDEAIDAHESALVIKKRPETEFYLGILLYFSPEGDKIRAKSLMLSAYNGTLQQEHDLRIRQVWKILMHAGVPIVNDDKVEALSVIESLKEYITTQRIYVGVESHLRFLLEGTGHSDWMQAFMNIVNTWKES